MNRTILIVLILLLSSATSCKFIRKKGWFGTGKADTMLVWQEQQANRRVTDSIARVRERIEARERVRIDSLNRIEQERLEYEARFRYHIVVGSFITPEYARGFNEHMQRKGYNSKIVQRPGSRFEFVAAEVHDNLKKAVERLWQFRDTVAVDTWIYIRR